MSTTTGKAARDNALKEASSDAGRLGSGEGGVCQRLIANTLFNPVGQARPLLLSLVAQLPLDRGNVW
jgi:hypothetical protein